jgi:hypothetical protein
MTEVFYIMKSVKIGLKRRKRGIKRVVEGVNLTQVLYLYIRKYHNETF